MNDLWRIVVFVVTQMLHIKKPLFDAPEQITISVSDSCRITSFRWKKGFGDMSE